VTTGSERHTVSLSFAAAHVMGRGGGTWDAARSASRCESSFSATPAPAAAVPRSRRPSDLAVLRPPSRRQRPRAQ
jgi:hypothetical protein